MTIGLARYVARGIGVLRLPMTRGPPPAHTAKADRRDVDGDTVSARVLTPRLGLRVTEGLGGLAIRVPQTRCRTSLSPSMPEEIEFINMEKRINRMPNRIIFIRATTLFLL